MLRGGEAKGKETVKKVKATIKVERYEREKTGLRSIPKQGMKFTSTDWLWEMGEEKA